MLDRLLAERDRIEALAHTARGTPIAASVGLQLNYVDRQLENLGVHADD